MANNSNANPKPQRTRNWSLVVYLDEVQLAQRLAVLENVRYFAYIVHDKDVKANGQPDEKHIHLAVCLNSARTLQQITMRFTDIASNAGNAFGQPTRCNKAIIEYFTHQNEPEKHQYSEDLIVSNNIEYFKNEEVDEDNAIMIIEDILKGKPLRELVKIYGRELLYHYTQYKQVAEDIRQQESSNE